MNTDPANDIPSIRTTGGNQQSRERWDQLPNFVVGKGYTKPWEVRASQNDGIVNNVQR
jgi:hypothetical protein